jgi:hypothetical protein
MSTLSVLDRLRVRRQVSRGHAPIATIELMPPDGRRLRSA